MNHDTYHILSSVHNVRVLTQHLPFIIILCNIHDISYCYDSFIQASLATPLANNEMLKLQKEPADIGTATATASDDATSLLQEMRDNVRLTEYKTAVVAVSLARHLCEHMDCLSLGAQTRILDTHDFLQMMVPLVDEPPWTRTRTRTRTRPTFPLSSSTDTDTETETCSSATVWEKLYDNSEWKEVEPSNLLQVTQCEAQCWIAVFHLTCTKVARERYYLNVFRKEQILKLRKYLNEVLLDQLPFLRDVMRYMDELAIMNVPEVGSNAGHGHGQGIGAGAGTALLMQQVDQIRESIVKTHLHGKNCDWRKVQENQFQSIFAICTDSNDEDLRMIADIYNEDNLGTCSFVTHTSVGTGTRTGINTIPSSTGTSDKDAVDKRPLMSVPITMIVLRAEVNGLMSDVYNLIPHEDETAVPSNDGVVLRSKLKLHSVHDNSLLFEEKLSLEAFLCIDHFDKFKTISLDAGLNIESKKIQWVQMGKIEEESYAIQLGFKKCTNNDDNKDVFLLKQAFVCRSN